MDITGLDKAQVLAAFVLHVGLSDPGLHHRGGDLDSDSR